MTLPEIDPCCAKALVVLFQGSSGYPVCLCLACLEDAAAAIKQRQEAEAWRARGNLT